MGENIVNSVVVDGEDSRSTPLSRNAFLFKQAVIVNFLRTGPIMPFTTMFTNKSALEIYRK